MLLPSCRVCIHADLPTAQPQAFCVGGRSAATLLPAVRPLPPAWCARQACVAPGLPRAMAALPLWAGASVDEAAVQRRLHDTTGSHSGAAAIEDPALPALLDPPNAAEFEGAKKSCARKLKVHNEQRLQGTRKVGRVAPAGSCQCPPAACSAVLLAHSQRPHSCAAMDQPCVAHACLESSAQPVGLTYGCLSVLKCTRLPELRNWPTNLHLNIHQLHTHF